MQCFLSLCVSVNRILRKLWTDFNEILCQYHMVLGQIHEILSTSSSQRVFL